GNRNRRGGGRLEADLAPLHFGRGGQQTLLATGPLQGGLAVPALRQVLLQGAALGGIEQVVEVIQQEFLPVSTRFHDRLLSERSRLSCPPPPAPPHKGGGEAGCSPSPLSGRGGRGVRGFRRAPCGVSARRCASGS